MVLLQSKDLIDWSKKRELFKSHVCITLSPTTRTEKGRDNFQVASPLQYESINTQTGDENTETDQLKDAILPNIKFSKPVLKEMYRSKKGELLIKSWR